MSQNRLKLVRRALGGVTQGKLAKEIGQPLHKIRDAETGKTKISTEIAKAIEEKFDFSFRWVLSGEGPMMNEINQTATGNGILQGQHIHAEEINIEVNHHACAEDAHLHYRRQEDHDQELGEILHLLKCDLPEEKTKVLKYLRARKELADAMKNMGDMKDLPE